MSLSKSLRNMLRIGPSARSKIVTHILTLEDGRTVRAKRKGSKTEYHTSAIDGKSAEHGVSSLGIREWLQSQKIAGFYGGSKVVKHEKK